MDVRRLAKAEPIFHAALDLPPDGRAELLSKHCGADTELRGLVESLIANHNAGMGSFLEAPTDGLPADTTRPESPCLPEPIGPYRILETVGEGGMGTVFVAEQTEPVRRTVALKVIKPGMDSKQVIARFEAERQALALMDHPNIAKVLDAGETEEGRPYFVMDLAKGEPITSYCDRHTLSTRERLELFLPVCHAVQHAHQKGIIHRDLKPSNIVVTVTDGRPLPKVIDFGIAKATSFDLTEKTLHTQLGQMLGTPEYMSPEQAAMGSIDVDTRSDVYSLGVILYELLTGALPFDPDTWRDAGVAEIQRILREEEPPRPSTRASTADAGSGEKARRRGTDPRSLTRQLRGELDWIVLKAMEKDRARRYETPTGLATDIGRFLRSEPVAAVRPSAVYRFRKLAKRHQVALAFAVTVFLGITGALVESNRQRGRIQSALKEARRARQETEIALDDAREARDESEAVTEFLAGMLGSVDPGERGRDVSVREVLDEASRTIGTEFQDQPLIEARLRQTVGHAYQALGRSEEAEANHLRAVALRSAEMGEEHPETLRSRYELAFTYVARGHYERADSLLRETLAAQRRLLGDEHPETLDTWNELGYVRCLCSRYDEAETIYLETLDIQRRVQGDEHPATLLTMRLLSTVYWRMLRLAEAESLAVRTVEIAGRTLGEEHPDTLDHRHHLARVYWEQRRLEEAKAIYEELIEVERRVYGEEHPKVAALLHNLALVHADQDHLEEAQALFREGLAMLQRTTGEDHVMVGRYLHNLGWSYHKQGNYAVAESLYCESLERDLEARGPDHYRTQYVAFDLGSLMATQGRREEALEYLRTAVEYGFSSAYRLDQRFYLFESLQGDPEFEALVSEIRRRAAAPEESSAASHRGS